MGRCHELLSSPNLPVVVCIFLYSSTHIGIMKVIGIYIRGINIDLRTTPTDIGVALGLLNTFSFITAPVGIALFRCHSFRRPLVISGACLPAVGVAMASMATSNGQVAICLSVTVSKAPLSKRRLAVPHFSLQIVCNIERAPLQLVGIANN
nr:uncharacterized protein LOC129280196 [Lytechinus pictus]